MHVLQHPHLKFPDFAPLVHYCMDALFLHFLLYEETPPYPLSRLGSRVKTQPATPHCMVLGSMEGSPSTYCTRCCTLMPYPRTLRTGRSGDYPFSQWVTGPYWQAPWGHCRADQTRPGLVCLCCWKGVLPKIFSQGWMILDLDRQWECIYFLTLYNFRCLSFEIC